MPTMSVENCLNFYILLFYSEIWQSAADSSETLLPCNYFVKKLQVVIQAEISNHLPSSKLQYKNLWASFSDPQTLLLLAQPTNP